MTRISNLPISFALLDGRYVNVTGDTMTGVLNTLNVIPTLDSNSNLGSTTLAFANLYVDTIASITGNALALTPVSGQSLTVNLATTGDFIVNTNQLVVDTSAGRVGIGTATPARPLNVSGDIPARFDNNGASSNDIIELYRGGVANFAFNYDTVTFSIRDITNDTKPFQIEPNTATNTLYLDSTGRVGIGTASPAATLDITSSELGTSVLRVVGNNTSNNTAVIDSTAISSGPVLSVIQNHASSTGTALVIRQDGTGYGAVITGGNVGIGTTSPNQALEVVGTTRLGGTKWFELSGSSTQTIWQTGPTGNTDILFTGQSNNYLTMNYKDFAFSTDSTGIVVMRPTGANGGLEWRTGGGTGAILMGLRSTNPAAYFQIYRNVGNNLFIVYNDGKMQNDTFDNTVSAERIYRDFGQTSSGILTVDTTFTTQRFTSFGIPNLAVNSGVTITNAANVYIEGAVNKTGLGTLNNNYSFWIDAGLPRVDSTTANGTVATVLGSVGPTGSNTTVQEWLTIDINGTTRYIPCF